MATEFSFVYLFVLDFLLEPILLDARIYKHGGVGGTFIVIQAELFIFYKLILDYLLL